jgi:hypothetical protein
MAENVEVGLTFLKCEELYKKNYQVYLQLLDQIGAKIETWHSGEPEPPLSVPPEQLFVAGGFHVWLKKQEIRVNLVLKSGVFLAQAETRATRTAALPLWCRGRSRRRARRLAQGNCRPERSLAVLVELPRP